MQNQQQLGHLVIFTVQVGQRHVQGFGDQSGSGQGRFMHTQLVPADPGPAAGLVNPDRNADLFLGPPQLFP